MVLCEQLYSHEGLLYNRRDYLFYFDTYEKHENILVFYIYTIWLNELIVEIKYGKIYSSLVLLFYQFQLAYLAFNFRRKP